MPTITFTNADDEEIFYKEIYEQYNKAVFFKTIRGDTSDYWNIFLPEILEKVYEQKYDIPIELLRKQKRRLKFPDESIKVTSNGPVNITEYKQQGGQFSAEQKKYFSKKQSISVMSPSQGYYPKPFGFDLRDLSGVLFFSQSSNANANLLTSINMMYDSGTFERPYYFSDMAKASAFYEKQKNNIWFTTTDELITQAIKKHDLKHNEILARIKWDPDDPTCQLGVFNDSLYSKILTQLRATDIKINTKQSFVPISFYLSNAEPPKEKIFPYYLKNQQEDLADALHSDNTTTRAIAIMINFLNDNQSGLQMIESIESISELKNEFLKLLASNKLTNLAKINFLEKYLHVDLSALSQLDKFNLAAQLSWVLNEKLQDNPESIKNILMTNLVEIASFYKYKIINTEGQVPQATTTTLTKNILLQFAVINGNLDDFNKIIDDNQTIDINTTDKQGNTMLHIAIQNHHSKLVEKLIELNAKIDIQDGDGLTPLHLAIKNGNIQVIKTLIQHDARIDIQDNDGYPPLHLAVINGNIEAIETLIKYKDGASINIQDNNGYTPLHLAVSNGNVEIIKILLQHDARIDIQDNDGYTPLHLAVSNGNVEIIKTLLQGQDDAKIGIQDNDGYTPLHLAVSNGNIEIIKTLLQYENGTSINIQDNNGYTPLHLAIMHNNKEVVAELLKHTDIDVNPKTDISSISLLEGAIVNNNLDIINMLIEKGAKVTEKIYQSTLTSTMVARQNINNILKKAYEAQNSTAKPIKRTR